MPATTGFCWRKDILIGGGSERCWAGSRCYRYGRDRELVAKAAAESVYSGVGVRRGVVKVGHKWGNFVLCWCGWQTVGSAPDENRFTVREQARRVYYGAVFKAKKEILAKIRDFKSAFSNLKFQSGAGRNRLCRP